MLLNLGKITSLPPSLSVVIHKLDFVISKAPSLISWRDKLACIKCEHQARFFIDYFIYINIDIDIYIDRYIYIYYIYHTYIYIYTIHTHTHKFSELSPSLCMGHRGFIRWRDLLLDSVWAAELTASFLNPPREYCSPLVLPQCSPPLVPTGSQSLVFQYLILHS